MKKVWHLSVSLASLLAISPVMPGSALAQGGGEGTAPPSFSVSQSTPSLEAGAGGKQNDSLGSAKTSPQNIQAQTPPPVSITQNTDPSTIITGNSVSCNAGGLHTDNSYFRRFDLDGAHGLMKKITVGGVDIGIETATGSTGSQPLEVQLYSIANGDPLLLANLNLIGSASVSQPDATLTVQNFPVTGSVDPLNDDLVVELFTPNGQSAGNSFFIGSNNLGQSAPSYIVAPDCGASEITNLGTLGFPGMHIVMVVHAGTESFPWPMFLPATNGAGAR